MIEIPGRPSDDELVTLLQRVYVDEGWTDPAIAATAFLPATVRARGLLLCAREANDAPLLGMVILVVPGSPMSRLARGKAAEMHLLAVAPEARQRGIGFALVNALLAHAREIGADAVDLWTQPSMIAAQNLYERCGFRREAARDFVQNQRNFLVYSRDLSQALDTQCPENQPIHR